jgi:hypothetical protein
MNKVDIDVCYINCFFSNDCLEKTFCSHRRSALHLYNGSDWYKLHDHFLKILMRTRVRLMKTVSKVFGAD